MRNLATAAAVVLCLTACKMPGTVPLIGASPEPAFPQDWTVVDLTRPLDRSAPFVRVPDEKNTFPFERMDLDASRPLGWRTGVYSGREQMGTHLAAPLARMPTGETAERIAASQLVAPLVVIDVPDAARDGGIVTKADVEADERAHGPVPVNSIVVLRTGRGALASSDPAFLSAKPDGSLAFPGWGDDAVRYLALDRHVRAVGTDAMAVDAGSRWREAPAQSAGSAAGLWFVAGLADLSRVPARGAVIFVGALPIAGAAGAPARVVALVPQR